MVRRTGWVDMSLVWAGLPGGSTPILSIPFALKRAVALSSQLALLTQDGQLLVYREDKVSFLETDPVLGPVRSISRRARVQEEIKCQAKEGEEEEEETLVCLLDSGEVYQVCLSSPVRIELLEYPGPGLVDLAEDLNHQVCTDHTGSVWTRGIVPYSGLVHHTDKFEKIPYFSGKSLVQLVCGLDFNVCLVRPSEAACSLDSSPEVQLTVPDGPSCPLGLSLSPASTEDRKDKYNGCDKFKTRCQTAVLTEVQAVLDVSDVSSDSGNSSTLSTSSSIMMPLPLDQVPEDTKASSEPPLSTQSSILSLEELEVLEADVLRSSSLRTQARRSASLHNLAPSLGFRRKVESLESLVVQGAEFRNTEVWVWGNGSRGQLGQGDILSRPSPVTIPVLIPQYIVKLSVGGQHALALTGSGQVYGWGNNNKGQSNPADFLAVVPYPTRIQLPRGETVRDILGVGQTSVLVCDSGNLYYTGLAPNYKSRLHCVKLGDLGLPPDTQPDSVLAAGEKFFLVTRPMSRYTCKVVSREKILLDQVETVANLVSSLQPAAAAPSLKLLSNASPLAEVWSSLEKAKDLLSVCVHRSMNAHALSDYSSTGLYRNLSSWRRVCTELGRNIGNCISSDCLLLDSNQTQHQHNIVDVLISKFGFHQQSIKGQMELEQLLLELFKLSEAYIKSLMELHTKLEEGKQLMDRISELMGLHQLLERQRQEAEDTRSFWKTAGPKLEEFCVPNRRLVLDSRAQPIALSGAMSKHWIVLLSDLLLDVGYSLTAHPLRTVWFDSLPVSGTSNRYEILLILPEETKVLVASTASARSEWVKGLLRATVGCTRSGPSLPPVTRSVEYEFVRGERKGAVYKGVMTQAKMHGKGSMRFPDGSVYQGEWRNGQQNGWGTLTFPDGSIQKGVWKKGKLTGEGSLRLSDGSVYDGELVDGLPHGHGMRKEGRFMGQGASVYIGEWEKGVRHGYGVMEDIMAGEKYMGMWVGGVRHGRGCVVNSDGIYYEGNFVCNKLTGAGIMIFEDGAVYEGEFCGAGEFSGKGVLSTRTERFEGTFHGNYGDGMRFNGVVYKSQEPRTPVLTQHGERIQRYTVASASKWISIFNKFENLLGTENPWNVLAVLINQNKSVLTDKGNVSPQDLDYLETIPDFGQSGELCWRDYSEICSYLSAASSCPLHPLYPVVQVLMQCFNTSYGGMRSHPTLLPHAKEELDSIAQRLYATLRKLFPALPAVSRHAWIYNPEADDDSFMITASSLMFPLLLPTIHPTLFHLYIQKEQKLDKEYWARVLRWNKHSDTALLTFFDVDISIWDLPAVDRRSREELFIDAVYALQRLKTTFSPGEKLDVIVSMFKAITGEAGTANHTWSMDSLLPVCMFVVVRARVLQLGAELAMLSDFMETYLFQGEKGIMFTTLQAAYTQILRENVFIT